MTAHPGIDYGEVLERAPVLVDLRGVTRKLAKNSTALTDMAAVAGNRPGTGAADSGDDHDKRLTASAASASSA